MRLPSKWILNYIWVVYVKKHVSGVSTTGYRFLIASWAEIGKYFHFQSGGSYLLMQAGKNVWKIRHFLDSFLQKWKRNVDIKKHLMLDSVREGIDRLIFPNGNWWMKVSLEKPEKFLMETAALAFLTRAPANGFQGFVFDRAGIHACLVASFKAFSVLQCFRKSRELCNQIWKHRPGVSQKNALKLFFFFKNIFS